MEDGEQITLPLYIVDSVHAERLLLVEEAVVERRGNKFVCTFEIPVDVRTDQAMANARSITNQS